jgi:type III pantothenate kinase
MILTLDVSNLYISIAIFSEEKCLASWRIAADNSKTIDEYGIQLLNLFEYKNIKPDHLEGAIISSVVPNLLGTMENVSKKYFRFKPVIVGVGLKTGINIKSQNPKELGADIIVNAVAAHEIYKRPTIVISFNTATTFSSISENGDFLGCAICPGINISLEVLHSRTSKLPLVELGAPPAVICTNTADSICAGVIYGHIGQVNFIVDMMKKEMSLFDSGEPLVVATGPFTNLIIDKLRCINAVNELLTSEGLKILYKKNSYMCEKA